MDSRRGRREFVALCGLAVLTQISTGLVAVLQGAQAIPWPSLLWRPLMIVPFFFLVPLLGRWASIVLSAWLGYLAVAYVFGIFVARDPMLKLMRGIACFDMAVSAIWLQASPHIRAYLRRAGKEAVKSGRA
jgi:hypothetical protein